jgi:hypothetical protein
MENARVNPIILIFMDASRQDSDEPSIPFWGEHSRLWR